MKDSVSNTLWSKAQLITRAVWHPVPVLTAFFALLGSMLLAAWNLWLPWFGGWSVIFVVATIARVANRRVQAEHLALSANYLSILEWQEKLTELLSDTSTKAPQFISSLEERLGAIVSRAEELAHLEKRLALTPGLKTLEAKSNRMREQRKRVKDEGARAEFKTALETQTATCDAIKRARALKERTTAQLCHMEATLESLYVQLLALDGKSPTKKMAHELDELMADVRTLDEAKVEVEKELVVNEELLPADVLKLTAHQALRDGKLDEGEKKLLLHLAKMLGLESGKAREIVSNELSMSRVSAVAGGRLNSCELFRSLLQQAHMDGVVSPVERNVLLLTARVLGLRPHQCEQIQREVLSKHRQAS